MASRLDRHPSAQPVPAPAAGAGGESEQDLAILFPDQDITVAGRQVRVREYGYIEGLRLAPRMKAFQRALYVLVAEGGAPPTFVQIEALLAEHAEDVRLLVAASADVEPEWIDSLRDVDGDLLYVTWWVVNAGFFIRRIQRESALARVRKTSSPSAGGGSSPP